VKAAAVWLRSEGQRGIVFVGIGKGVGVVWVGSWAGDGIFTGGEKGGQKQGRRPNATGWIDGLTGTENWLMLGHKRKVFVWSSPDVMQKAGWICWWWRGGTVRFPNGYVQQAAVSAQVRLQQGGHAWTRIRIFFFARGQVEQAAQEEEEAIWEGPWEPKGDACSILRGQLQGRREGQARAPGQRYLGGGVVWW
jgi:hypothetical protein